MLWTVVDQKTLVLLNVRMRLSLINSFRTGLELLMLKKRIAPSGNEIVEDSLDSLKIMCTLSFSQTHLTYRTVHSPLLFCEIVDGERWVRQNASSPPLPRAFCTFPSFARIKRSRRRPVKLNDRHLRSHGKIGDWEQSTFDQTDKVRYSLNVRNIALALILSITYACSQLIWWNPYLMAL